MKVPELNPKSPTPTAYPPKIPITIKSIVKRGTEIIPARRRGEIKYFIEEVGHLNLTLLLLRL